MTMFPAFMLTLGLTAAPLPLIQTAGQADASVTMNVPQASGAAQAPRGPTNVKLDLAITDTYGGTPSRKTVSMLILPSQNGRIRTSNVLPGTGIEVKLNVDAQVSMSAPGYMTVMVTFEYTPAQVQADAAASQRPAQLNESIHVALQDGKPLIVSQSADPVTDRRVTVELTATIQK
jgi:hypothetical protein